MNVPSLRFTARCCSPGRERVLLSDTLILLHLDDLGYSSPYPTTPLKIRALAADFMSSWIRNDDDDVVEKSQQVR